jgi:hypothetical protein
VLYDVQYLNRKASTTGLATDTVTGSKRYAIERAAYLRDRGTPATVVDTHGKTIG